MATLALLVVAAGLEIGGDAAIRVGLGRRGWLWLVSGAALLIAYGLVVNLNRSIDFGRLLGTYIAVFFLVSQLVSMVAFSERPAMTQIIGGVLIVLGGLVIQIGQR